MIIWRRAQQAFTLLELLVVGVIMLVVLFITIPNIEPRFLFDPLNRAARTIAAEVGKARQIGRTSESYCRLIIDPVKNTLSISETLDSAESTPAGPVLGPRRVLNLPEGVTLRVVRPESAPNQAAGPVLIWVNNRGMVDSFILHLSDGTRTLLVQNQPFLPDLIISVHDPQRGES